MEREKYERAVEIQKELALIDQQRVNIKKFEELHQQNPEQLSVAFIWHEQKFFKEQLICDNSFLTIVDVLEVYKEKLDRREAQLNGEFYRL